MNKERDDFFDEQSGNDQASDQLLKMIEQYDKKVRTDITPGLKVTGKVTRIGSEYVFIDIGAKNEALMKVTELSGENGELSVKVGDKISAFVVSDRADEIILSKSMGGQSVPVSELIEAMNSRVPVQGKVTGINKGGLNVKIMGNRAFCPVSQIDIKFTEDINSYLGKTMDFVITRITEGGRNIVVSRIPLIEQDLGSRFDALQDAVVNHTVLRGKITKITDFGLFVDLNNIEGLVHISEVSWERAEKLDELFSVGQDIEVVVLKVEKKEPLRNSRISLSIKQVLDDPWKSVSSKFSPGQSVQGKVTRLTNFGAFIELIPGVEGLVHISEMSWGKRIHHPSEVVQEGNLVNVNILAIDENKKTISLSLKDVSNDPWRDVESRFPVGSEVSGTVARKSRYGYFVDLDQGVTALLVFGNISKEKKDTLKEGDVITVTVESVDTENRRISLSYGVTETVNNNKEVSEYLNSQEKVLQEKKASTEFGSALLAALKGKK